MPEQQPEILEFFNAEETRLMYEALVKCPETWIQRGDYDEFEALKMRVLGKLKPLLQ